MGTRKVCRHERTLGRMLIYATDLMKLHPPNQKGDDAE